MYATCVRLLALSFFMMLRTCTFTVFSRTSEFKLAESRLTRYS